MDLDAKMMAAIFAIVTSMATVVKVLWSKFLDSTKKTEKLQEGFIEEIVEDRNRYRDELLPAIENTTETLRALKAAREQDRAVYLQEIAPAIKQLEAAVIELRREADSDA